MIRIVKLIVFVLALAMLGVAAWYFSHIEETLDSLSRNEYLYSGIMMIGIASFGLMVVEVIGLRVDAWNSLLDAGLFAGFFSAIVIYKNGNPSWIIPGWCAVFTCLGCFYLRFLRHRN